ncbi:hypothetical protein QBC41DRAFT_322954 [Cercophora samala]|uniref:DUF6594 domain-containing protein n=1 Tax=Cercophora samala TaxID=330535 RepID=A0AA39ZCI5_9PEZI|nr:hypothetical protein QBC41DRAFT_322954 [Cercophora samala]
MKSESCSSGTQPSRPEPQQSPLPQYEPRHNNWQSQGGYGELSWFMNSSPDQNFNQVRKFGRLSTRCLLYLQDELSEMELRLDRMDKSHHGSISRRRDTHPHRKALVGLIQEKLQTYNNLVLQRAEMQKLKAANSSQSRSYELWVNEMKPVVEEELESLRHEDDRIVLGGPDRDWLYKKIERLYWPIFTSERERKIAPDYPFILYSSETRLRRATRSLVLLGTLAFILGPILALSHVKHENGRLVIVCGSISGFGLLVTVMTKTRTFEIAAAIAAYAAVVTVFLGAT